MKSILFSWNNAEYVFHIGQNQYENAQLVEVSDPYDIWFHVQYMPSAHVVWKRNPEHTDRKEMVIEKCWKNIPLPILKRGAGLCKEHTMKCKSMMKCPIQYTFIANVQNTSIPGTVLIAGRTRTIVL